MSFPSVTSRPGLRPTKVGLAGLVFTWLVALLLHVGFIALLVWVIARVVKAVMS